MLLNIALEEESVKNEEQFGKSENGNWNIRKEMSQMKENTV